MIIAKIRHNLHLVKTTISQFIKMKKHALSKIKLSCKILRYNWISKFIKTNFLDCSEEFILINMSY